MNEINNGPSGPFSFLLTPRWVNNDVDRQILDSLEHNQVRFYPIAIRQKIDEYFGDWVTHYLPIFCQNNLEILNRKIDQIDQDKITHNWVFRISF